MIMRSGTPPLLLLLFAFAATAVLPTRPLPAQTAAGEAAGVAAGDERPEPDGRDDEYAQDGEDGEDGDTGSLPIADALPADEPDGLDAQLDRAFATYKRLFDSGRYPSAIDAGKRVVVLSIEVNGRENLQTARALTNLAIAQQKNGDYEAAEQNYEAAIEIVQAVDSRLSPHMINPLRGLGNTYLEAGRPDQAILAYDRAIHLTHVNSGPQNLEQADLLDALSESFVRLQDLEEASEIQDLSYQLYERRFGSDDPRILPALERRARWLHRLGLFGQERTVYSQIIHIIEEAYGEDDLRLIRPLHGLARTYLYDVEKAVTNRGEWALRRAVEIAEEHPDGTPLLVADSMIATGDYHGLRGEAQKARRAYGNAWDLLSADETLIDDRDERFARPVKIREASAPAYADEETNPVVNPVYRGREFDRGTVVVEYTVNTRGRAEDITVVESVPPGLMDSEAKRAVRRFIYRPRYEAGEPTATPGQTFRHSYAYIAERLPDEIAEAMADSEAAPGSPPAQPPAADGAGPPPGD